MASDFNNYRTGLNSDEKRKSSALPVPVSCFPFPGEIMFFLWNCLFLRAQVSSLKAAQMGAEQMVLSQLAMLRHDSSIIPYGSNLLLLLLKIPFAPPPFGRLALTCLGIRGVVGSGCWTGRGRARAGPVDLL